MKTGTFNLTLVLVFLALPSLLLAQQPVIDLSAEPFTFTGRGRAAWPDTDLFQDPANNTIGNACIRGATRAELRKLTIPDLDARLQKLVAGNAVVLRGNKCFLNFPVLVSKQRERVAAVVNRKARRLAPQVAPMLDQITKAVPGNEEMGFHLLWSRVMDQAFYPVWQLEKRQGDGPPGVVWLIYPHHPFTFGTNYWGRDYAVTTSPRTKCYLTPAVSESRLLLLKAAWGQAAAGEQVPELPRYGLLDENGGFTGFAYHARDPLDLLLQNLTGKYAALLAGAYNYDSLAKSLGVPVEELWVILLHETAYAIFENLSRSGKLHIPTALSGDPASVACRAAVSFFLDKPVSAEDEVADLFRKSGWRGDERTIAECRRTLKSDPNDRGVLYYLGLSLYQMQDYAEALAVFKKLNQLTEEHDYNDRHLLSHLWMGHLYDLLGQREEAVRQYRAVVESKDADGLLNYSGYHIGPTTPRAWAEERLKTPYTRRN